MIVLREARPDDSLALVRLFMEAPIRSGSDFVLDRGPDFFALLRLRGCFRTFLIAEGGRLAGAVTAVWHQSPDGDGQIRVGEVADLRVAQWARGGMVVARLLGAVREVFTEEGVDWVRCLIGARNAEALLLVLGRAGFPRLRPLGYYTSLHFPAFRLPGGPRRNGVQVREVLPGEANALVEFMNQAGTPRAFQPAEHIPWPDPAGQHRAWIACDEVGRVVGALVLWDGQPVRRLRVVRYGTGDQLLRTVMGLAAKAGVTAALPPLGQPLRVWASRWFGVHNADPEIGKALVRASIRAASRSGQHVLQLNLAGDDPLVTARPALPHAVFRTAVFGCPFPVADAGVEPVDRRMCHADVAFA